MPEVSRHGRSSAGSSTPMRAHRLPRSHPIPPRSTMNNSIDHAAHHPSPPSTRRTTRARDRVTAIAGRGNGDGADDRRDHASSPSPVSRRRGRRQRLVGRPQHVPIAVGPRSRRRERLVGIRHDQPCVLDAAERHRPRRATGNARLQPGRRSGRQRQQRCGVQPHVDDAARVTSNCGCRGRSTPSGCFART